MCCTQISYDPTQISYEELVDKFLASHNPTAPGPTQYMSAAWPHGKEQEETLRRKFQDYEAKTGRALATKVLEPKEFHRAEEYHQKYIQKNGQQCVIC